MSEKPNRKPISVFVRSMQQETRHTSDRSTRQLPLKRMSMNVNMADTHMGRIHHPHHRCLLASFPSNPFFKLSHSLRTKIDPIWITQFEPWSMPILQSMNGLILGKKTSKQSASHKSINSLDMGEDSVTKGVKNAHTQWKVALNGGDILSISIFIQSSAAAASKSSSTAPAVVSNTDSMCVSININTERERKQNKINRNLDGGKNVERPGGLDKIDRFFSYIDLWLNWRIWNANKPGEKGCDNFFPFPSTKKGPRQIWQILCIESTTWSK